MITQDLDAGLALCDAATPGPWHQTGYEYRNEVIQTTHLTRDVWKIAECLYDGEVDAEFIAWANPSRIRELITEVKEFRHLMRLERGEI